MAMIRCDSFLDKFKCKTNRIGWQTECRICERKISQGQLQDIWSDKLVPFTKVGNTGGRTGLEGYAGTGHVNFEMSSKYTNKYQIEKLIANSRSL